MGYEQGEYAMVDEVMDIKRVLSRELSFGEWWQLLRTAKAYKYYVSFDRMPALLVMPMFIYRIIVKLFRMCQRKCLLKLIPCVNHKSSSNVIEYEEDKW